MRPFMNEITIIGDYRLAFIKHGSVVGHECVGIDFTPRPKLPRTDWPLKMTDMGPSMGSLAKYHSGACPMANRFPQKDKEGCRCKRWYSWLRKELSQKTH